VNGFSHPSTLNLNEALANFLKVDQNHIMAIGFWAIKIGLSHEKKSFSSLLEKGDDKN